jgi:uridine phosphorylase
MRATDGNGKTYHLRTCADDLAWRCILVGDPARARLIAERFLEESREFNNPRQMVCFTGTYKGVPVSVVTTGMGSGSTAIALPEAVASGARIFVRVGSCSSLRAEAEVGHVAIASGAVRCDGASDNWAPKEYPAVATPRLVVALEDAAAELGVQSHTGIGVTTTCFYEGQGRSTEQADIPYWMAERHAWYLNNYGTLFYSMEEATIYTWCATHGEYPCVSVCAIYGNRVTDNFRPHAGEEDAIRVALNAIIKVPDTLIPAHLRA